MQWSQPSTRIQKTGRYYYGDTDNDCRALPFNLIKYLGTWLVQLLAQFGDDFAVRKRYT